jgi:hypothetical protein
MFTQDVSICMCLYIYIYGHTHFNFNSNFFKVEIYCGLFCYSLYPFVTMEGNGSPSNKKSKKQIQHVIKLKFLTLYNIIELTYDCNKGRGCRTKGHTQQQYNKLYVIPCVKTLSCQYFKDMFINIPLDEDLVVLEIQQYYISFCLKICEECLERLHLECSDHIACPICEETPDFNYLTHTRWIFNMSISKGFKIQNFQ